MTRTMLTLFLGLVLCVTAAADEAAAPAAPASALKPASSSSPAESKESPMQTVREFIQEQTESGKIDTSKPGWKQSLPEFPKVKFAPGEEYTWRLETNVGDIQVKLMPDIAPNHVANFLYLTELGFFDGLEFHRVITGFMAQGGCPKGDGRGSPGYRFDGELDPKVKHDKPGLLSMANAGPGTDGSQFFLTFVPTPWLDGKHTIFGEVKAGEETLDALEKRGSQSGRTTEKLMIKKAAIDVED